MNLFSELPLLGSIILNIVIVVMLYSATYIGTLAILQHPRNWNIIPAWKKTLLTFSVLLTALFCSVFVTDIDFATVHIPTLAVAGAFLVILLLIISAPSFALDHGSHMLWEFLARYSDRLLFGLLLAVGIAGYWLPSIKLIALFGFAFLIELGWRWRLHREERFRVEQPLNDHSLAVLHTQARGNLGGFAKKHGIKELVQDGGEVRWMGCSKHSPPCPINFYVNKLGLNTPPCCLEHMEELCFAVDQSLTEMSIPHWIDGGTLLGAVRENGRFLAWEDDIDISYMLEDSINGDAFVSELTSKLTAQGFLVRSAGAFKPLYIYYKPPTGWLYDLEQHRYRGEIRVDLVGNRVVESYGQKVMERNLHKGAMSQTESGRYGIPVEMMMPTSEIELLGKMVSCPADSDAYLRTVYGNYTEVDYTYVDTQVASSRKNIDEADNT